MFSYHSQTHAFDQSELEMPHQSQTRMTALTVLNKNDNING